MPPAPREPRPFVSEIKFLIDPPTAQRVRDWARVHLSPDPYGTGPYSDEYQTTSLYLDTQQLDVFHRRGSFGRAKYRVRRYGNGSTLFLERKLKNRGLLHKRRTAVEVEALDRLTLADPGARDWHGQWFHRRLLARQLHPICEISYSRTARMTLNDDGPVRLTIDEAVQARPAEGLRFAMSPGIPTLERQCILEFKYRHAPPALLKRLVEQFRLEPQPVSKYRLSVEALGLVNALNA
jgi:hypothetical protein